MSVPLDPVLVTGANGFIGAALCEKLTAAGCETRGLILKGTDPTVLDRMQVAWRAGDITDPASLEGVFEGVKTVFHVAALARDWGRWKVFFAVNLGGTRNVIEAAARAGVRRFVHVSSLAVHDFKGHVDGDETTPAVNRINGYCASKIEAEALVNGYMDRMEVVIVRPGAIIHGPGDLTTFVHLAPYLEKGRLIIARGGNSLTCYAYSENLASAMLLAGARAEAVGETFTLNDDLKLSVRELMVKICEPLGAPTDKIKSVPLWVARAGALLMEGLWRMALRPNPPPVHRYRVAIVARDFHFHAKKARRLLGYHPEVSLEEGLARTVAWYRDWRRR